MSYCVHCGGQVPEGAAFCPSCGKPPAGPVVSTGTRSSKIWIVLAGCLVLLAVVAVLGIIAAIAVPNFVDALHKAKQKRALADLRSIGQAVELYKAEHGFAPAAEEPAGLPAALVERAASSSVPRLDPWQHPYRYTCWREGPGRAGCDHYRIASAGRDGRFEQLDLRAYQPGDFPARDYDHDIVYGDGDFIVARRPGR
jgi:general secretion pathway protein G